METDPPRVSSTGMCGDLRLSTTVINRLDLAKADSHTGGMMLSFSNRARSRMACLAVVITALLCAAYPPKAVGTTQEDRWQWPTGAPVPVVEGFSPPAHDWLPGRRGVTLRYPAPSAVYACAPGTVTVAGPVAGRGVISIHHSVRGRDIWSTYLHRPDPPDNRAPASAPLGRGHGRVGASRSPSTCRRSTLSG